MLPLKRAWLMEELHYKLLPIVLAPIKLSQVNPQGGNGNSIVYNFSALSFWIGSSCVD